MTRLLDLDPRDRFSPNVDEVVTNSKQRFNWIGHAFMMAFLALIVLVYMKNTNLYPSKSFTYKEALLYPTLVLILLAGTIIYYRYINKLRDSHKKVHCLLTTFLVIVAVSLAGLVAILALYYDDQATMKPLMFIGLILFYVVFATLLGVFIFVSPGLLNKVNGIPRSNYVLLIVYLTFLAFYPIIYYSAVQTTPDPDDASTGSIMP